MQDAVRPAHRPWRWASAVAGVGALIGVVSIIAFTQSDQDTTDPYGVSDTSFDVAEANRFETLRDLATGSAADASFEVAEANRMETLRDLATGASFEVAEANRFEVLRDLATDASFDVAEANRMATLRDLATGRHVRERAPLENARRRDGLAKLVFATRPGSVRRLWLHPDHHSSVAGATASPTAAAPA